MIIIYKSKTGFTEKYAKILAKELNCDIVDIKNIATVSLKEQDVVIYGSRVHAGIIDGFKKMKQLQKDGTIKDLVVFATGGTPNQATDLIEELWKNNLMGEELEKIPHFYMQSGICYEKMGKIDRFIMEIASRMMKKKKEKDYNEEGFVQAVDKSYDISSKEYVKPLVTYIQNNYKKKDK